MKKLASYVIFLIIWFTDLPTAAAQQTKNLIFITLDGLRWQEVFSGADSLLINDAQFVHGDSAKPFYSEVTPEARRKQLMPFFWNTIESKGQLYGNRSHNNEVNCANPHWFSYPGYSEIFTGFIEPKIKSNRSITNPNPTFLEFLHSKAEYDKRVAAFATWGTFNDILREKKSKIPVNAGYDKAFAQPTATEAILDSLQQAIVTPIGVRYDSITFRYAMEYLKMQRPKVLFLGLDETDEYGHKGRYDQYLFAAHQADKMIEELWMWLQSQADYKNQTTIIITTDHGRGNGKHWTGHGRLKAGSNHVWLAVMGPDTPALGEIKTATRHYLKQLASTAVALLGYTYDASRPTGKVIESVFTDQRYADLKDSRSKKDRISKR
ncbi:alkaline phosphatase family protein [Pseudochryseolinea flava]|uniref:Phosphoglyceromutase n=1 Tax=Pseudochryseolinea flava TaxID=2059302 RepID=A0A364XVL4_9BACT|nr:alkaline phosphatase family protein [Pseudochryseolinea flava]RAV98169.1 phosphoglyceromutase [Pseudochryseolinea flava]